MSAPPAAGPDPTVTEALGLDARGRRKPRWRLPLALVAVVVVVAVAVFAWPRDSTAKWTWTTAAVEKGDLTVQVTAVGTLEPLHSVSVSSDLSGTVATVEVDSNDHVEVGQVLARLDTQLLEAQERQVRAQHASARASQRQAQVTAAAARAELSRAEKLHAAQAISDAALDQARTSYDQATASVDVAAAQLQQAQAALDAARTNLEHAVITAPIAGVVLARNIDPGQAVVSALQAATLFEVAEDLDRMSIDVEVDEADIGRVSAGQRADFTVAAFSDRVFDAQVHKVELAPKANTQVVTYIACLHLDNQDGALRPGMTATARIEAEHYSDRLLLPTAALRFSPPEIELPAPQPRDGKRVGRVWVLDGGQPRAIEVITSATDGRQAIVEEGELTAGDQVLIRAERRKGRSRP